MRNDRFKELTKEGHQRGEHQRGERHRGRGDDSRHHGP